MCPGALAISRVPAAGTETGLGVVAGGGGLQRNTSSSEKARAGPVSLEHTEKEQIPIQTSRCLGMQANPRQQHAMGRQASL